MYNSGICTVQLKKVRTINIAVIDLVYVWIVLAPGHLGIFYGSCTLFTGLQVQILAKITLKLGLTVLFTHLKIILLPCFQFSIFSNKQYPNRPLSTNFLGYRLIVGLYFLGYTF